MIHTGPVYRDEDQSVPEGPEPKGGPEETEGRGGGR